MAAARANQRRGRQLKEADLASFVVVVERVKLVRQVNWTHWQFVFRPITMAAYDWNGKRRSIGAKANRNSAQLGAIN